MSSSHRPDTLFQDQIARSVCRALVDTGTIRGSAIDVHLGAFGGWQVVLDESLPIDRPAGLGLALGDTINLIVDLLTASADGETPITTSNPAASKLESLGFEGRRDAERFRVSAQIDPLPLFLFLARRHLGDATVDRLIDAASNRYLSTSR